MQIELLLRDIIGPAEALAVVQDPEHGQPRHAQQQHRGQRDDQRVLAPLTRAALGVLRVVGPRALPAREEEGGQFGGSGGSG